jgi:hypothetical protein
MTRARVLRAAERVLQLRGLMLKRITLPGEETFTDTYEVTNSRDDRRWLAVEATGPNTYDGIGFELVA